MLRVWRGSTVECDTHVCHYTHIVALCLRLVITIIKLDVERAVIILSSHNTMKPTATAAVSGDDTALEARCPQWMCQ